MSPRKELINFLKKNATKKFPINKFEYIPYKLLKINDNYDKINQFLIDSCLNCFNSESAFIKLNRKVSTGLVKSNSRQSIRVKNTIIKDLRNISASKINSKYSADIDEYKIKTNMFLIEDFIDDLSFTKEIKNDDMNQINENEEQKEDIEKFNSLFNKFKNLFSNVENNTNIYLETLLKSLNYYRSKGLFMLNKKSYDCLIDIFKLLLENFSSYDFLLKNILILAQTFYIKNDKTTKIFLQQGIKNHPLFSKAETWHRVINYTLYENVNKDINVKIDKNEQNNKLGLLAFNTLVSYLNDLIYFTDDMSVFDEVKDFYVTIYKLDINKLNEQLNEILGDKIKHISRDNKG